MPIVTLQAHYDGKHIVLDEDFELTPNSRLMVTVLSSETFDFVRASWVQVSRKGLSRAYGDEEPEYSLKDIRP